MMKIQQLLLSSLTSLLLVSCGGRDKVDPPVQPGRMADSVKAEWQKPHDPVLRIHLDADLPTSILASFSFKTSSAEGYYNVDTRADQMMTHPFEREYELFATESQTELAFTATVGEATYDARTILPHMPENTRTQVNLTLRGGHLGVISSWMEDYSGGAAVIPSRTDSVYVGCYLCSDGHIRREHDETSVAVVIETDGKHGKAVSLSDAEGEWVFSSSGASSGHIFPTLDGRKEEGMLSSPSDSLGSLFYFASLPYPESSAFSCKEGYQLCENLMTLHSDTIGKGMLDAVDLKAGSYVPSAAEMAGLYTMLSGTKGFRCSHLVPLKGAYLTSSESGSDTCYSMNFGKGALSGYTSKRYIPLRIRPFYLF